MKISPTDLKKQNFGKTFRGFDPAEVESFLGLAAAEMEELLRENKELRDKALEQETRLKDYILVEKAIQQTFQQAQETTGKAVEAARKEAHLIIQEAEMKAAQIVEKARNDLISLKEHITILKAKKDSIVSRLKMLLHSELELLKALEIDEELQTHDPVAAHQELARQKTEIEEIIRSLE